MTRYPDEFQPEEPADFIGMAAKVSGVLVRKGQRPCKMRILLHGNPGCGKSAVARVVSRTLALPHNVSHVSAGQLNAELLRLWILENRHRRTEWRVFHIDEADMITPIVEILMLQFLDDLPPMTAVLCTSNLTMGELSDRFQSRFQCIHLQRPAVEDVKGFLLSRWPALGEATAETIAVATNGDVRAALNDAQGYLDLGGVVVNEQ